MCLCSFYLRNETMLELAATEKTMLKPMNHWGFWCSFCVFLGDVCTACAYFLVTDVLVLRGT